MTRLVGRHGNGSVRPPRNMTALARQAPQASTVADLPLQDAERSQSGHASGKAGSLADSHDLVDVLVGGRSLLREAPG